jgi:hypothetical protein
MMHRALNSHPPVAAAAAALVLALAATAPGRANPPAAPATTIEVPDAYLSLSTRASRHGAYRAGVVERRADARGETWIVRLTRADGSPVEDAGLRATPWMPDAGVRMEPRVITGTALGGGLYRIDGLRFAQAGWWTVPVRIGEGGRADRVVFNLIVPADAVRGGAS